MCHKNGHTPFASPGLSQYSYINIAITTKGYKLMQHLFYLNNEYLLGTERTEPLSYTVCFTADREHGHIKASRHHGLDCISGGTLLPMSDNLGGGGAARVSRAHCLDEERRWVRQAACGHSSR
jgi:hypothetical protein